MRSTPLTLVLPLLLTLLALTAGAEPQPALLPEGLEWETRTVSVTGQEVPVRVIRRLASSTQLVLRPAVPVKGLRQPQTLRDIAKSHSAIAAINGGFFGPGGYPIGTIVIEGQVASLDTRSRSAIGLLNTGQYQIAPLEAKAFVTFDDYFEPVWLWGYNQPLKSKAVVLYNRWLGASQVSLSAGQRGLRLQDGVVLAKPGSGAQKLGGQPPALPSAIDPNEGEPVKRVVSISNRDLPSSKPNVPTLPVGPAVLGFNESQHPALKRLQEAKSIYEGVVLPPQWKQATSLLTAGPMLVQQGKVQSQEGNPEGFSSDILGRATRSVVGLTRTGEILFIQYPQPVTLDQAARGAIELGCFQALNLDGGGSIGLWAKRTDGTEICFGCSGRRLGSALVLVEGTAVGGPLVPYFDGTVFKQWQAIRSGTG